MAFRFISGEPIFWTSSIVGRLPSFSCIWASSRTSASTNSRIAFWSERCESR